MIQGNTIVFCSSSFNTTSLPLVRISLNIVCNKVSFCLHYNTILETKVTCL